MYLIDMAFNLKVGLRRDAHTDVVTAYCPALNIYSAGSDEAEAHKAISSTIQLYLETCFQRGQFEQVMRKAHFARVAPGDVATAKSAEFIAIRESDYDTILDVNVTLPMASREGDGECLH
jgi:hypothetical protein